MKQCMDCTGLQGGERLLRELRIASLCNNSNGNEDIMEAVMKQRLDIDTPIEIRPLTPVEVGEVVRLLRSGDQGLKKLLQYSVGLEDTELDKIDTHTFSKLAREAWRISIAQFQKFVNSLAEICHAFDPNIFPDLRAPDHKEQFVSESQLLELANKFASIDVNSLFRKFLSLTIVDTNIADRERVFEDPRIYEYVCLEFLRWNDVDPAKLDLLPEDLFPSFQSKFLALWELSFTLELEPFLQSLRLLEEIIRKLRVVGYQFGGYRIPAELLNEDEFQIPLPFVSLLDRVPLDTVVIAAIADMRKQGKPRLSEPYQREFKSLFDKAAAALALDEQTMQLLRAQDIPSPAHKEIAWQFIQKLTEIVSESPDLVKELRVQYFSEFLKSVIYISEGLERGRLLTPPRTINCILLVEGKSEYISLPRFASSLDMDFHLLGVLLVNSEGKSNIPNDFLKYKKAFRGVPIVCVLDRDAMEQEKEIDRMMRTAPEGSKCFRSDEGSFVDHISSEQIATLLNILYPDGDLIQVSDFEGVTPPILGQIEAIVKKKKLAEYDKVAFAELASKTIRDLEEIPSFFRMVIEYLQKIT